MFSIRNQEGRLFSSISSFYDLVVIGGGSGGLAAAREAVKFNKKVALIDYVEPSVHGNSWGVGGCCVNVGCIPKKLMHHSALIKQHVRDAKDFGWIGNGEGDEIVIKHDWSHLVSNVQNVIKSMNFGYRVSLRDEKVQYINAKASFIDKHTLKLDFNNKPSSAIRATSILIATGGRPRYIDIPGSNLAITSDDLFSLPSPPGKTLLIGGGYVALECAGFLQEFGLETSVMVRGPVLREFDQQMAEMIQLSMISNGTKFIQPGRPLSISKQADNRLVVKYNIRSNDKEIMKEEVFDTVVMATGRQASSKSLNLENVGIATSENDGKIIVTDDDLTSVSNIYAIGDVALGRPELTPPAIKAGQLLTQRLFNHSRKLMNYHAIPTTIFSPLEYGCVGLSEEKAISQYGKDEIEVYHSKYDTLELQMAHRVDHQGNALSAICYSKIIYEKKDNDQGRVLGVHIFGPNAGEIAQGFALAVKLRAKKEDIESLIGIHPTHAEEVVLLRKSKSQGVDPTKKGC